MRTNWRWLRKGLILSLLPLVFALYAMADGDGDRKETKYRWDIVKITSFNPPTVSEGGFASALANDGSRITLTGHGTFEPREPDEVTGGGTWTTFAPNGTTVTGHGTYRVRQFVRFDVAPGVMTAGTVDNIPGAKGDLTDNRAGLMFVRIAYSDGSKGVLVFSCGLDGSPASIFEGVTASKGYTDYWNTLPSLTLFHILSQDENRDRE
jgi:hypothetical protein